MWGVQTYAIGGNEEAGAAQRRERAAVKVRSYVLSGICAGIAGMILLLGRFGRASARLAIRRPDGDRGGGGRRRKPRGCGRGTAAIGVLLGALVIGLTENGIFILRWDQNSGKSSSVRRF